MKKLVYLITIAAFLTTSLINAQNNPEKSRFVNSDGYISQAKGISGIEDFISMGNPFEQKSLSLLWENDEDVSNHQDVDSWNPRLTVENNGTIHIVFNDNQNQLPFAQKIMYTKKEVGGTWTTPLIVDENTIFGSRNNHVPAIAVSPNGDVYVAFLAWAYENWRHEMAYTHYDVATQTWSQAIIISEAGGSIESFEHIEIYSTEDNQPVVLWGFDNRTGIDEVYMNYYDGGNWSGDILVSTPEDNKPARFPRIEKIDDTRAMILFWEETSETEVLEIRYRIYNTSDHSLTAVTPVPQTINHTENFSFPDFNFDLSNKNNGYMIISLWEYEYPVSGAMSDTIKCIDYNIGEDTFEMSPFKLTGSSGGFFPKSLTIACDNDGNTGIVFMDTYTDKIKFVEFDPVIGFLPLETLVSEDFLAGDLPDSDFDNEGNMHLTWGDLRFDAPGGFVEREVFYKKGANAPSYSITFIVTELDGTTPIEGATVNLEGNSDVTNSDGEVVFYGYFAGTYTWVASKTGYEPQSGEVTVVDEDVTVEISLNTITSIPDYEFPETSIYPNPTSENINLPSEYDNFNYKIFSVNGELISLGEIKTGKINLNQLDKGVYIVKIVSGENIVFKTFRVIKK